MKVFFLTQEEPFYLPWLWERILFDHAHEWAGIAICQPKFRRESWLSMAKRHLGLFGPAVFVRQSARFAVRKVLAKLDRLACLHPHSVAEAARRAGVPVYRPANINTHAFRETVRDSGAQVLASICCPQVVGQKLLSIPAKGPINVHCAPLPRYRGMMPSFWVLAKNEKETAVTVHVMEKELDDGDIILQRPVPIDPDETQDSLIRKTKALTATLMLEALDLLEADAVELKPNDAADATYFGFPTPDDVREFHAAGRRFL